MDKYCIEVFNLSHKYCQTWGLKDINCVVGKNVCCGIFGPNGSGKSTFLKCIINAEKYEYGEILIQGQMARKMGAQELASLVAYVPQEHKQVFGYTVAEMVLMGRTPNIAGAGPDKEDKAIAAEALESLGIIHLARKRFNELSGGQRQLTLIARAVVQDTPIILMDEPTSSLDFDNQLLVWRIADMLRDQGKTLLVSSHDPNHILWYCDEVLVMNNGRVILNGEPDKIFTKELFHQLYYNECAVSCIEGTKIIHPVL